LEWEFCGFKNSRDREKFYKIYTDYLDELETKKSK